MSNRSDESSGFMSFVALAIVGCAFLAKTMTRLPSAEDAVMSLFTMIGWLLLLAAIGFVAYWSLDFINIFIKSSEDAADKEKSSREQSQENSNYVEPSLQKKYDGMTLRLRQLEDELIQARKKQIEVPEPQPLAQPLVVPLTPDQSELYDVNEEDLVEDDDEPSEMCLY